MTISDEQDNTEPNEGTSEFEEDTSLWITVSDVIHFTGLKPQHLQLQKADTNGLNTIVQEWIKQSQSLIKSYTHNNFEEVSDAVKNICLRLTANMVALAVARRDTPITQPNDWTVEILSSEIFSDDLKDDLEPYVINSVSGKSDHITVYAITGDQPW